MVNNIDVLKAPEFKYKDFKNKLLRYLLVPKESTFEEDLSK